MRVHHRSSAQDVISMSLIIICTILFAYFVSYFILRDFRIFTQPCGKKEPLVADFKYFNNYQHSYGRGKSSAKFSYFNKNEQINFYSIYRPLEKIEMYLNSFNYETLSRSEIANLKKEGDFYRNKYIEMRIYDQFDESKL